MPCFRYRGVVFCGFKTCWSYCNGVCDIISLKLGCDIKCNSSFVAEIIQFCVKFIGCEFDRGSDERYFKYKNMHIVSKWFLGGWL